MNRIYLGLAALSTMLAPPAAAQPPIVGGNGLCPNAAALAAYIQATYPGVTSIGGVRGDALPDHPSGHALDIMVPTLSLGDTIAADIRSQTTRFAVRYVLWKVPNHFNHVHVTVA